MQGKRWQALWVAGLVAGGCGRGDVAPVEVRAEREGLGGPARPGDAHRDRGDHREDDQGLLAVLVSPAPVQAGVPFRVTVSGLAPRGRHEDGDARVTVRFSSPDLEPRTARAREGSASFPGLVTCRTGDFLAAARTEGARGGASYTVLPGPAASVTTAGDGQHTEVGTMLPAPLMVTVRDGCGNPIPGLEVRWTGVGAAPAVASSTTDASGTASTGATLSTLAGPAIVTAAVLGLPPVNFQAWGIAGAFEVLSFRNLPEAVTAGQVLKPPLEVALVDAYGNQTLNGGVEVTLGLRRDGILLPWGLTGTVMVIADGGFARFADVAIRDPGGNLALVATAGELRFESPPFLSQCVRGTADCGGQCVDLGGNDPANCGACGQACTPGDECAQGACRTPFRVVATAPAAGASGLLPEVLEAIEIQFTTAVDLASVAANLSITSSAGALPPLATQVVGGNRLVLRPALPRWPAGARVTVELGAGLRDLSGLSLGVPFSWSFEFLPLPGLPFLSQPGASGQADPAAYYANQPLQSDCDLWGSGNWLCYRFGAPTSFDSWVATFTWVDQTPPPDTLGPPVVFFNADDLSLGRRVFCGQQWATVNPGIFCAIANHGVPTGMTGTPDPSLVLEQTLTRQVPLSISTMSRSMSSDREHQTQFLTQRQTSVPQPSWYVQAGDVLTLGPASGSIWAGNIFFGRNGPDGAGVPCSSNLFATCPLDGAPLYGLLVNLPSGSTSGGADVSGKRFLGTGGLTVKFGSGGPVWFEVNDPVLVHVGDGLFSWEATVTRANTVTFQVYGPGGTQPLLGSTQLDSQGAKAVPQACLSCHGGRWDPSTQTVTGASFLPFDVGRLVFSTSPGFTRAAQEARLRDLNQLVLATGPNGGRADGPIAAWIRGTYAQGLPANDTYTPPGWATDVRLYQRVVRPYCQVCHQAMDPALDFSTAAGFRALTAAIRQDVCVSHTMPHAEPTFVGFWQSGAQRVLSEELLGGAPCGP